MTSLEESWFPFFLFPVQDLPRQDFLANLITPRTRSLHAISITLYQPVSPLRSINTGCVLPFLSLVGISHALRSQRGHSKPNDRRARELELLKRR